MSRHHRPIPLGMDTYALTAIAGIVLTLYIMRRRVRQGKRKPTF